MVSENAGGISANDANIRLVYYLDYGVMALFSSVKLEISGGRTIVYIDHCHPNLLMYKLLTSTDDENERGFVGNQGSRDCQLKGHHVDDEHGHMYMMIKMRDLLGFVNDLEKILYGIGFKVIVSNKNVRTLFRVNTGACAIANDGNIEINDISWCVPSTDPGNENMIIVQKVLKKKNGIDFSFHERKTFYKKVPNATNFLLYFSIEKGMGRPQYLIVGFLNNNVNEQIYDASVFNIISVTECYCKIGSEFYPDDGMKINNGTNNDNEVFKEVGTFNKDYHGLLYNIKPYLNHITFKSNYRIYVFDTRDQNDHIGPHIVLKVMIIRYLI